MAKNGGNTTRVCDEVPQSGAPGAPFLTWTPIGAPIGAPVCNGKNDERL